MNDHLSIAEFTKTCDPSQPQLVSNLLKITNTSTNFINNIRLTIHTDKLPICEEAIIRQRGALSFDPSTQCLELGNLAPNETAYFEYKFLSPTSLTSLCDHFLISYCDDKETFCKINEKVTDYLTSPASTS